jgi:general secretion pathway protein C
MFKGQFASTVRKIVNLMLAIWLVTELLQLARLFVPAPTMQNDTQLHRSDVTAPRKQTSQESARLLAEMHLFGVPVTQQIPVKPASIEAPDTELSIVLHGIFASGDPRIAHAIIADNSGREESYAIGEEIPIGIKVHEIHADRVILWHNQRYETLRLPDDRINNDVKPLKAATGVASDRRGSQARPIIKKQSDSLNDLISTQPARINGEFIGFRISRLKDNSLFEKSGLKKDDIITWINEVDIDNPMKGIRALNSISSGDYVNMTVRREGQDISLSFHMP